MILTVLNYELRYWLRQPLFYGYALALFGIGAGLSIEMSTGTANAFGGRTLNSASFLFDVCRRALVLLLFLMPSIFGTALTRDWSTGVHQVLYVHPLRKRDYLAAKFGSALLVLAGLMFLLLAGYFLGTLFPWRNPELFGPVRLMPYLQLYFMFLLPNAIIAGSMMFGVVLLSRTAFAGYLLLLVLLCVSLLFAQLTGGDSGIWRAITSPLGTQAFVFERQYWTVAEQNANLFSWTDIILWNRIAWLAVAAAGLWLAGRSFRLEQTQTFVWPAVARRGWLRRSNTDQPSPNKQTGTDTAAVNASLSLPSAKLSFTRRNHLATVWPVAWFYLRQVLCSRLFQLLLLASLALVLLLLFTISPRYGTEELPTTWRMLEIPATMFAGLVNAVTFLYAGWLIHRDRTVGAEQLVDATAAPAWVLLTGKFLSLALVQLLLLLLLMVGGVLTQFSRGFYAIDPGLYVFGIFCLSLPHFLIYAALGFFAHSVWRRFYLVVFGLLLLPVGFIALRELGPELFGISILEQDWLRFNQGPGEIYGLQYSALDGYGPALRAFFVYKAYWGLAGLILLGLSLLAWPRGFLAGRERWRMARERFRGLPRRLLLFCLAVFGGLAAWLYYENNVATPFFARAQVRSELKRAGEDYRRFVDFPQPRITAVDLAVDLYPSERRFTAVGNYQLVNRSATEQDTLVVNYRSGTELTYRLDRAYSTLSADTIANVGHFDVLRLGHPLLPGDSLLLHFSVETPPATVLHYNELVRAQGTFLDDGVFPRLGNWLDYLAGSPVTDRPLPSDTAALSRSTVSRDSDRIRFRTVVSTAGNQTAIATGRLVAQWREGERNYFHYAADEPITHAFLYLSGSYDARRESWRGVPLEVYAPPGHGYNVDRILAGARASLNYCADHYGPYPYDHARIVAFAQTGAASAHGFPGTIPAGEGSCFFAALDGQDYPGADYAFGTAAHEIAHQWWGNRVLPADVRGAKLVVESTAEYVTLRVREAYEGRARVRQTIRDGMDRYLRDRTRDRRGEQPLINAYPTQNYLFYLKGAFALHTLGDYLGDRKLDDALANYLREVADRPGPYTTAPELVSYLRRATPDSLRYLIEDCFETITLYDNALTDWSVAALDDGTYRISVTGSVRKYRTDTTGQRGPDLPLADYLELGLFDKDGEKILLERLRFDQPDFELSFVTDVPPERVELDPYYRFPDRERRDNTLRRN